MFMGEFRHSLDPKGRLIIPSKFRELLGENFVIAKGQNNCLYGYPEGTWKQIIEGIKTGPMEASQKQKVVRFFYSGASDCEFDKQGRINIPNNLSDYAHLEKDCVVIGVQDRIEIWNKETWETYVQEASDEFNALEFNPFESF
ncbi:MAG: cell division/cell wall cluster transcriptional repressor MraZ [Bacillales bacterium]|nr:cell division/cell wall cluster transcriptional repressor MraZ [Bacillales bacterium]